MTQRPPLGGRLLCAVQHKVHEQEVGIMHGFNVGVTATVEQVQDMLMKGACAYPDCAARIVRVVPDSECSVDVHRLDDDILLNPCACADMN